jgi:hypothetical protein
LGSNVLYSRTWSWGCLFHAGMELNYNLNSKFSQNRRQFKTYRSFNEPVVLES